VRFGLAVPFRRPPRQHRLPPETLPGADKETISSEVRAFLLGKVIQIITHPSSTPLSFYHTHFTIPKKEVGAFRHIINMRSGNRFVTKTHFKMESLGTLSQVASKDAWCTKVDIKSAFPHVGILAAHRDFFRFRWGGQHYRFCAMPFGYRDAPRVFTKLVRSALTPLRAKGLVLVAYLDDILLLSSSHQTCLGQTQTLVNHLHSLGFDLKEEKCVLSPTRVIEFLGFVFNSEDMTLSLPETKVKDLHTEVCRLLKVSSERAVDAHHLQKVLGKLRAAHPGFEPAALYSRALQWDLRKALSHGGHRHGTVLLSPDSRDDLRWWQDHLLSWTGRLLVSPPPQLVVTTDASSTGWGGWVSHPLDLETPLASTFGHWTPSESARSSNWRETMTSLLVLRSFGQMLQGQAILLRTDNKSNAANLMRGGGRTKDLTLVAREVWQFLRERSCTLSAAYHPGSINVLADNLSRREKDTNDWCLHPDLFRLLETRWGPFDTDLFATRNNCQLPRYFSRYPDPQATAVDAFAQDWGPLKAYGNPPFILMGRVLQQVALQKASVVLVVPEWRSAPWWPLLFPLLTDLPVRLPRTTQTFRPSSTGNLRGVGLPRWDTICVRLSGQSSQASDFQKRLLQQSSRLTGQTRPLQEDSFGGDSVAIATLLESHPWPAL